MSKVDRKDKKSEILDRNLAPFLVALLTLFEVSCTRERLETSIGPNDPIETISTNATLAFVEEYGHEEEMIERQINFYLSEIEATLEKINATNDYKEKRAEIKNLQAKLNQLISLDKNKDNEKITELLVELFEKKFEGFFDEKKPGEKSEQWIDIQEVIATELVNRFGQPEVEDVLKEALLDAKYEWDKAKIAPLFKDQPELLISALANRIEFERVKIKESDEMYGADNLKKLSPAGDKTRNAAIKVGLSVGFKGYEAIVTPLKSDPNFRKKLEKMAQKAPRASLVAEKIRKALNEEVING